jgi:Transcriptional regulators of sugar metabolism
MINELPASRHQNILSIINEKEKVHIFEIAKYCSISEATARRDLDYLCSKGLIIRTRGGALSKNATAFETPQLEKRQLFMAEKERIAKYAAELVSDGESLFLDSGTTTLMIAENLISYKDLKIITNNIDIISNVFFHSSSTLIVTGGIRRNNYSTLAGSITESFIRDIEVDKVFIGVDAIDSKSGIYSNSFEEIGLKRIINDCGRQAILVTDHSKFYKPGLVKINPLSKYNMIITDDGLEEEDIKNIKGQNIDLVTV